jgi:hypothetical protein
VVSPGFITSTNEFEIRLIVVLKFAERVHGKSMKIGKKKKMGQKLWNVFNWLLRRPKNYITTDTGTLKFMKR